jgi:hypothetical protein
MEREKISAEELRRILNRQLAEAGERVRFEPIKRSDPWSSAHLSIPVLDKPSEGESGIAIALLRQAEDQYEVT